MEKLNEKHETEMNKLIAANDASERSNALSLSRVEMFDGQIKSINVRILKHFGESEYNARYVGYFIRNYINVFYHS